MNNLARDFLFIALNRRMHVKEQYIFLAQHLGFKKKEANTMEKEIFYKVHEQ